MYTIDIMGDKYIRNRQGTIIGYFDGDWVRDRNGKLVARYDKADDRTRTREGFIVGSGDLRLLELGNRGS